MTDELVALTTRLVSYDSCEPDAVHEAAGFVKGWLEARGIEATTEDVRGLPVTQGGGRARTGRRRSSSTATSTSSRGSRGSSTPTIDGDRLYGRGAYDMKGALAAMLVVTAAMRDQDEVRVRLGIVGDEESEEEADRGSDHLVDGGFIGDFAITGEPTDLQIGVEAKGVLALRLEVSGVAAHGATPWLGDNAVLKAHDVFRSIESLPFARQSSELFDRPSINLGRIVGRRRAQQGARPLCDRCRHPLPPRTGPGDRARAGAVASGPTSTSSRCSAGRRRSSTGARPSCWRCATPPPNTTRASR